MKCFTLQVAVSAMFVAAAPRVAAQEFDVSPPSGWQVVVTALSSDGTVAVGSYVASGERRPFRWTAEGGSLDIAQGATGFLESLCCSGAGAVVLGFGDFWGRLGPWIWTAEDGFRDFVVGGGIIVPYSVSEDGLAVAGFRFGDNAVENYRWTGAFGFQTLPPAPGENAMGFDISADGSTIVGILHFGGTGTFLWSVTTGSISLPLQARDGAVERPAVSYDGSYVVGSIDGFACRYTVATQEIRYLYETNGSQVREHAVDVSADGATVLLRGGRIWTEKNGLAPGVSSPGVGMSSDGAVIAGERHVRWLRPPSPYTYPPCRGDVTEDDAVSIYDLVKMLTEFREIGDDLLTDVTGDGVVDLLDLNIVLHGFGEVCD